MANGMVKKQFEAKTIRADKRADWVVGIFDNGVLINNFGVAHILNKLTEENEELKTKVDFYKSFQKDARELEKENEQLKHDLALYEENNINEVLDQLKIELTSRLKDCIEEFKE